MNALQDKGVQAALVLAAVALAGLVALGIAWSGVAATLLPEVQMPYLVSGAIGGVALAGTAMAVLGTHLERRNSAWDRAVLDDIIGMATAIAEDLPLAVGHGVDLVRNGPTLHRPDCRVIRTKDVERVGRWEDTSRLRACRICKPEVGRG